ncbi:MFS transporter [Variovorax sp. PAMC28562]|uniref:MFS transporter n=1 Tax=Variovorax sp. PAMC28562 TaxID=2762323 RepID=UPI00164CFFB6|nr:MFS transporter [Variovorax sp. PAMC28562]QNK73515.1 MFS transporter [Variovorax sp. PAMC28562]
MSTNALQRHQPDSRYAMLRLFVTLLIMTVGSCGMYVVSVVLPAIQSDFGVARAEASLPYTLLMIGFGLGGIVMGKLADRHGVMWPLLLGAVCVGVGFVASSFATGIVAFSVVQGVFVGLGSGAVFAPLVADTSLWFVKRRGMAVAVCASGNYLAGAVWPPIVQKFVEASGWRATYVGLGLFCGLAMAGLSLFMRTRPPANVMDAPPAAVAGRAGIDAAARPFGFSLGTAQGLLCVAGTACCVAMAMPQVHIVAYCTDLGFGAARGAQMLSLMLACGIVSRLVSGALCDRIGGLRTLLLGSMLQCVALFMFLPFDGMVPLFVVSAMFGLFQGGLVPSYAIIVREYFPPAEASARVGTVIGCTLLGMALGGWMSGKVFDLTGSYHAAFVNGIAWNLLNMSIAAMLLLRTRRLHGAVPAAV